MMRIAAAQAGGFYRSFGKRALDVVLAGVAAVLLAPALLGLAIAVRLRIGSPIFFRQMRAGRNGVAFKIIKFRTMRDDRDATGCLLSDAERLTPFGRWLRSTSLDELPELWNVLQGDMSLVGPRPLLMAYLDRYSADQSRRHAIRPGLTGWAQVNGRNALSWEERFALDVWYVDQFSIMTDLDILCRTVVKVLRRDGISASDHATMPEFLGSNQPLAERPATRFFSGRAAGLS